MTKQLSLVLKLSLEEMALRRVIVNLWNEADVLATIQNFRIKANGLYRYWGIKNIEEWRETVEEKVKAKVSNLHIPGSLKKQMMPLVTPIGYEILKWKIFQKKFDADVLEQLCWASTGNIDDRKTVEKVVRLEAIDVEKRYELACSYCFEDYLPVLWEELPIERKKDLILGLDHSTAGQVDLEVYWAYVLRGEKSYLDSVTPIRFSERFSSSHQCAFESSVLARCKSAIKYFFQRLTSEERDSSLARTAHAVISERYFYFGTDVFTQKNIPDVLCYLLSVMSPEQQKEVLKKYPLEVLRLFLEWPWQDLFLDIADLVWTYLPESDNSLLIKNITTEIVNAGCYFPNLIQKFFLLIPTEFRKDFALFLCCFFPKFLHNEDTETIKLFFRNVDPELRASLVLESRFLRFLDDLMLKDKWHLVEVYIKEASLSKENKEELKEAFLNEFSPISRKRKLTRFFEILEETEVSAPRK